MSSPLTIASGAVGVLRRAIKPEQGIQSPEAAQEYLRLNFDPKDRERMKDLGSKARAGALSAEEERELTDYELVGYLLGMLHAKARIPAQTKPEAAPSRTRTRRRRTGS